MTKNAPRSSGAISSFGEKLNKKTVRAKVAAKNENIIFLLLIQVIKDCLYKIFIFFKIFSNLITIFDLFIFLFRNLLQA